jgi:F-type H+-transporting ATPase subunit delta
VVNRTLARRYAVAIAALAREQNAVDQVTAGLNALATAIDGSVRVREFYESPVIDRPSKERMLLEIFDGKVHPIALHALLLLVRKRREVLLRAIVEEYISLERAARGVEMLTLESAHAIDRGEYARLVSRLEERYKRKFEITEVVDPELIGGLRIVMGDRRIDASVAGRLSALARELSEAN